MITTSWHFGLFFGDYCAGVTCVGRVAGAGIAVADQFGIARDEIAYLARGACVHWAPTGANSRLVSWTARLVARSTTRKLLIAYADADAGEVGTIYQAAGWVYVGRGLKTWQYVAPNGRIYDAKLPDGLRRQAGTLATVTWQEQKRALLAAGWHIQPTNPKHRYVCVLDRSNRALVERVESMRQPYPKRAKHPADAPADQAGEGGAAPTRTLQEIDV